MSAPQSAVAEWRRHWPLPIAAGLGYSLGVIHVYSIGAFIGPLGEEFGWTRAEVTSGLTMTGFVSALAAFPIGLLVDRMGPRRVGLIGAILMGLGFALLSTANGDINNWLLLWGVFAIATFWVQTTVWTSAVASRFAKSRGIAFAVTLTGASLAGYLFPQMAVRFIADYGWRNAFIYMAALWSVLVLIALLVFFRGAQDQGRKAEAAAAPAPDLPGLTLAEGFRSFTFYKLILAALLFAFTALGIVVHFIPVLTDAGAEPAAAAAIAANVGIFSIVGRLGMGVLLDRFPARFVGALAYLIPIPACLLLLFDGANPTSQIAAAALIGLTVGAEVDVVAYLASRHFGLKKFGGLFGCIVAALSLGTAFGPLVAGHVFDAFRSYEYFLIGTIVLMSLSSLLLASLPSPRFSETPA